MKKARLAAKEMSKAKTLSISIIFAIVMIPFVLLWFSVLMGVYGLLENIGKSDMLLIFGFGIGSFWVFFFNVLRIMGSFYFADDIKSYFHLPVEPHEILLAKFCTLLKLSYTILGIIVGPIIIVNLINNFTIQLLIYSIIGFLGLPIVTLVITSILVMIIMSSSKKFHNKDLFKGFAGFMSLAIGIGVNIWLRSSNAFDGGETGLVDIVKSFEAKYNWIKYMPDMRLLKEGLVNHNQLIGIPYMIGFILVIAISIFVFIAVAKKLYLGGAVNLNESSSIKKKKSSNNFERMSVLRSYSLYERRKVIRNPNFFISLVLNGFIWTGFLIMYSIFDGNIDSIRNFFREDNGIGWQYLISMAVITFAMAGNPLLTTPISRAGKSLFAEKYLPIDLENQLKGKMIVNLEVLGAIIFVYGVLVYYLSLNVILSIFVVLTSFLLIVALSFRGLEVDLAAPNLYWENEQELRKGNFSGVGMMFLFELLTGGAVLVGYILSLFTELSLIYGVILFLIVYGAMIYYQKKNFYKYSIKRFREILEEESH
jgi:ABC-2 type transport system permease protein